LSALVANKGTIIYTIQKHHPSSSIIQNPILEVINTNCSIICFTTIHKNILFLPVYT